MEQLEAVAQELAGACPPDPDADHLRALPGTLRPVGASAAAAEQRARALEVETERWAALAELGDVPVPEVRFECGASAQEVDAPVQATPLHGERNWAAAFLLGFMAVSGVVAGAAKAAGSAAQAGAQAASGASPKERQDAASALPSGQQLKAQAQGKLDEVKQNAPETAEAAASGGSKGAWGAFLAALFTMLGSAAGGAMGIPDRARATPVRAAVPDTRPVPQHA